MLAMHARIVEENGTAETLPKSYAALRAVEWSRDRRRRGLSRSDAGGVPSNMSRFVVSDGPPVTGDPLRAMRFLGLPRARGADDADRKGTARGLCVPT
jgi:hypothetical protein